MDAMSETGEQGLAPQDPADSAGIGGGIVPDDQTDGYEQLAQSQQRGRQAEHAEDESDEH